MSLLGAASLGYGLIVRVRNALYDQRVLRTARVNAAVLSVGNLTTGGTGKTPLVIWLCRLLQERRVRSAILTRGYKMQQGALSDEPALLAEACPGVAVVVNPDRVAGAAEAIRSHGAQVLVMDDGFQHRRLARDLDIVAIDATRPFGYGRILPAGLLRESVTGLRRAHAVVLTRCDQVAEEKLQQIEQQIRRTNRGLVVVRSVHAPVGIRTADGAEIGLDRIRGQRVFAFCGIGNPAAFFATVERLGGVLVGSQAYDDHHPYAGSDWDRIRREAVAQGATLILTTQKDGTKIARWANGPEPPSPACLAVELRLTAGADGLTALIERVLTGIMLRR
ncbi:MAG: tetraacyldisaccharide 4'-kinase [Planctomycetes bacterium]|nr:tetraacyldisaccharide 4'-kinase [Planctomycetota bacterium]